MDLSRDSHYHDSIAGEYDQVVLAPREFATQRLFAPALRKLARHAPFGQMVDLGCGTGHMVRRLGHLATRITGVDHSAGMLEVARRAAVEGGLAQAQFVNADLETFLAEHPDHADLMTAVGVLHHLDAGGLERVLAAAFRSVRSRGWLLLAEPVADGPIVEPAAITRWNQRSLAAQRDYAAAADDPDEAPLPPTQLRSAIFRAGFTPVLERRRWEVYNHSSAPGVFERMRIEWLQRRHAGTGFIYTCLARKA
jgi:ubiquinone/menaquinone biosynthesis C-methylase UbiE